MASPMIVPKEPESARVPHLDDYSLIVGEPEIHELRELAHRIGGRRVKMINSTAVGGGVAELLNRIVPLMDELGVPTRWEVLKGGEDFFVVTKGFHNALHGASVEVRPEWFDLFLRVIEDNKKSIELDDDFIVIHDPQPVALVQAREGLQNKWVWRCHIDLSRPNIEVWNFLRPFIEKYDATLFFIPFLHARSEHPSIPVLPNDRSFG